MDKFRRFTDHVLGDQVAGLHAEDCRVPKWSLVLKYEAELRKNTYKYIRTGEATDIGDAINKACRAPDLLAFHFVTPFSLGNFVLSSATTFCRTRHMFRCRRSLWLLGPDKGPARATARTPASAVWPQCYQRHSRSSVFHGKEIRLCS